MTPDELLKELRDIQLPDAAPVSHAAELSLLPFLVLAVALLAVSVIRYSRSRLWLRQARRKLSDIREDDPRSVSELLALASRIAAYRRVTPLPDAAYLPQQSMRPHDVKRLHQHLRKVLAK